MSLPPPLITVFTPVYNRENTIHRVYDSLQAQTRRNFEWLVVDDGSTDGTGALLEQYKNLVDFPMRVFSQKNQGKHVAWNFAVMHAAGELFLPADSDDSFEPNTTAFFEDEWKKLSAADHDRLSGVSVLCKDAATGNVCGTAFPFEGETDTLELAYVYRLHGEKWGIIRTDLLRQRLFPVFPEESIRFVPETWIWHHLAKRYKIKVFNIALRNYYQNHNDSLSRGDCRKIWDSPRTRLTYCKWHLENNYRYLSPLETLKFAFLCCCYYRICGGDVSLRVHGIIPRISILFCLLPSKFYRWCK